MAPEYPQSLALLAEDLSAARGWRILFERLSFSVRGGEVLELRGPNGSGKSTMLRILAGLTQPASGSVRIEGVEREAQRRYLGHLDAVKPTETALQQLVFWARFHGRPETAAEDALAQVGLASRADVPGRGLSAGQKRRLALGRLIVDPCPIWLLDEPVAALDMDGRALVERLITDHAARGGLVIAAMHGSGFPGARTLDLSAPAVAA
jgi:heme exporter protein A